MAWAPPTSTCKNNPCTTGLLPIPKTPPKIELDVAPPSRNSGTSGPGESHFIEKTTINSFASSVTDIVSLPTSALMLGPQTLNIGQKVTYVGKPTNSARMVTLPLGLRPLTQVNKSRTRGQQTHERLTGHAGSWSERFHKYPSAPHAESYIIGLCYWYRDAPTWLPNQGIENNLLGRRDCNYWLDKDAIGTTTPSTSLGGPFSVSSKGQASTALARSLRQHERQASGCQPQLF
ncbi:hypothetical protein F5882DRAFT_465365 [Hyaloscypha sp. PMI_1271]|nr:hypothetical protein F5882DRAFT_465365 [Hyaloscypha sp. PMI_1271]